MSQLEADRSRRHHWSVRLGSALAASSLAVALPAASAAAADVDAVSGTATGVSITGDAGVIPPTPTVSVSADETTPPSGLGPFTATAPSVTLPSPYPFNVFSTGALAVSTTAANLAGDDEGGSVEAQALVQNVILGPNIATASSIASSCRADGQGARGATVIQGGMLNGQPFPPTPTPAPNTVIPVAGLGTVTLNEQVVTSGSGSGGATRKLVVNAVHARFASGSGGILPDDQTAEAIIGQVTCEATSADTTPNPPTTPVTSPPVVRSPPAAPGGSLASTGSDDGLLALGLVALGLGGLTWSARRSCREGPA